MKTKYIVNPGRSIQVYNGVAHAGFVFDDLKWIKGNTDEEKMKVIDFQLKCNAISIVKQEEKEEPQPVKQEKPVEKKIVTKKAPVKSGAKVKKK